MSPRIWSKHLDDDFSGLLNFYFETHQTSSISNHKTKTRKNTYLGFFVSDITAANISSVTFLKKFSANSILRDIKNFHSSTSAAGVIYNNWRSTAQPKKPSLPTSSLTRTENTTWKAETISPQKAYHQQKMAL